MFITTALWHSQGMTGNVAETVVEQTAEAIRQAIREGRLVPGQRLVVADLTRQFQVSAGPAREAISRLTGEGLVEVVPHRGATVRLLSTEQVREIFEVREVVEGLAARLAAEAVGASDEAAGKVRDSIAEMHDILARRSPEYIEHNHRFHAMIYDLAGNVRARDVAAGLTLPIYRLRYHQLMDPAYAAVSAAEHTDIAEAILAGDGPRAEAAMRAHIRHSAGAMIDALGKRRG